MSATAILRTRIDPRRKARVEKILDQLGMTSTQAANMFFAQIERRKAIPFPLTVEDNSDIAPPIEQVAKVWGQPRPDGLFAPGPRMSPNPGELYLIDLGMVGKVRPAVVISRDDPDAPKALAICAPLTTENRGSDYEVALGKLKFLDRESWVNVQV